MDIIMFVRRTQIWIDLANRIWSDRGSVLRTVRVTKSPLLLRVTLAAFAAGMVITSAQAQTVQTQSPAALERAKRSSRNRPRRPHRSPAAVIPMAPGLQLPTVTGAIQQNGPVALSPIAVAKLTSAPLISRIIEQSRSTRLRGPFAKSISVIRTEPIISLLPAAI